ncbi:hypothetical protein JRI60_52695 [Archangium violaceum]|uniref:hypothetical protein n=1 Tax=Archangium violaceum TaxID=83451 RepID=UPI00194EDA96|nr:hypothetical protein [Archangium violaceum]QRN97494.1 hypothetical protein JRI60_52695 [Archangium violaceum]
MRNRIASAVLAAGLMAGVACGPSDTEPSRDSASSGAETALEELAPKQATDVFAQSTLPYTIVWDDFSRTGSGYNICSSYFYRTCRDCYVYNQSSYYQSLCPSPTDINPVGCRVCNYTYTDRVLLPGGDLIDVSIEHNATAPDGIEFRLESAPNVKWWKQVALTGVVDYWTVWNQNGQSWCNWPDPQTAGCNTNSQWADVALNPGSRFVFSKTQSSGTREDTYVLHNLAERLTGGDRVTFRWVEDITDPN